MKRVVTGFLLSLLILLSGGYTQIYAHAQQQLAIVPSSQLVKHGLPGTDKIQHVVDVTIEEEDDDNTSSKKYIDDSSFSIQTYSDNASAQRSQFGSSLSHSPHSPTYILFRVFRV